MNEKNEKTKKLPKNYHYFEVKILHVDDPVSFDESGTKYFKTVCLIIGELEEIYFSERYELGIHRIALRLSPVMTPNGKRLHKFKGPMTREKQKELGLL